MKNKKEETKGKLKQWKRNYDKKTMKEKRPNNNISNLISALSYGPQEENYWAFLKTILCASHPKGWE